MTIPAPARRPATGPAWVTFVGVALMLIAAVAAGFAVRAFIGVLPSGVLALDGSSGGDVVAAIDAGAQGTATLEPGSYTMWLAAAGSDAALTGPVQVTGPDGRTLELRDPSTSSQVTMGDTHAVASSTFTVTTAGRYVVSVPAGVPSTARVLIVPAGSERDFVTGLLGTVGGAFLSVGLALVGAGMVVGGGIWWWVRRHPKPRPVV
ncbi:MAG: hypothetical protein L6311_08685 [Cellulomonas sp.]|nr:hypothetical protein [Cellulomonas sp.]